MKIALIVEGETEEVFVPKLREFLQPRLAGAMPGLHPVPQAGRIPTGAKLQRLVHNLLNGSKPAEHVSALTDVYTGTRPPQFADATDAKDKMRNWAGRDPRFHPHVALHDFEAWLLPYWPVIQRLAGHNRSCPSGDPKE